MGSRLILRHQLLRLSLAVELSAVEIALRGILRRRNVINPSFLGIGSEEIQHIERSWGQYTNLLAIPGNQINMPPAVLFADPQKIFAAVQPFQTVDYIHPCTVVVLVDAAYRACSRIGQQHV